MKQPTYILIDRDTLTVRISTRRSNKHFIIPIAKSEIPQGIHSIREQLIDWVLDPAARATWKKAHPDLVKKGVRVAFCVGSPDPWHIALAYLMWQGIVQGLAWDIVKLSIREALKALSSYNLAPESTVTKASKLRKASIGFSYTEYASDGKKQREMFLGLKKGHEYVREYERDEVQKSLLPKKTAIRREAGKSPNTGLEGKKS